MPEDVPISMFCGLPVMVAVEPIFDAIATASRYGTGRRRSAWARSTTNGASTRQIASLTRKADAMPDTRIIAPSNSTGRRAWPATHLVAIAKIPTGADLQPPASCRAAGSAYRGQLPCRHPATRSHRTQASGHRRPRQSQHGRSKGRERGRWPGRGSWRRRWLRRLSDAAAHPVAAAREGPGQRKSSAPPGRR